MSVNYLQQTTGCVRTYGPEACTPGLVLQGVLLTHRAVVATVAATVVFLDQIAPNVGNGESVNKNDVMLSYLPLAHIFDRAAEETFLYLGGHNANLKLPFIL